MLLRNAETHFSSCVAVHLLGHLDDNLSNVAASNHVVKRLLGLIKRKHTIQQRRKANLSLLQMSIQLLEIALRADSNTPILILAMNHEDLSSFYIRCHWQNLLESGTLPQELEEFTWVPVPGESSKESHNLYRTIARNGINV